MSPTSTDLRPRPAGRFGRALIGLLMTLVILLAGFLTLGYLQGPKLSHAQVDANSVTSRPGQQLRLFANQPLAQVKSQQVIIRPDVAHSITTQGDVIAVQFDARLDYATKYTVTVKDVTSLYQAQPATLTYSFTTGTPDIYYLDRGQPTDAVVRTTINGTTRTTIYSAPHIQDFVVAGNALAVVTLASDHTSDLTLVSLSDGVVEDVPLPEKGVIQKLQAASSGTLIGFQFTSAGDSLYPTYWSTLLTLDLDGARKFIPVLGLSGQPVQTLDWEFMPDGSSLLALSLERDLLLIDPLTSGAVTPLGQFTGLGRVSGDGTVVTMNDAFGSSALTIADGSQVRISPSRLVNDNSRAYLGPAEVLGAGSRIEKLVISLPGGKRFASAIAIDDGQTARVIYRTPDDAGGIDDFSVSPNGQYVAIEVVPDTGSSVSDGYYYDAKSTSVETVIVDIGSGSIVRTVEGFSLRW